MKSNNRPKEMPHFIRKFQSELKQFRKIAHMSRTEVCATMNISHKRYTQLMAVIRQETGKLTRNERAKQNLERARAWLGDRDPRAIGPIQFAAAIGVTKGQAARYRSTLIWEHAQPEQPQGQPKQQTKIAVKKSERLFWTVGSRLFCEHRQPQEVGA